MHEKVITSDIAGAKEIAETLGMSTAGLSNLRNRYSDFPEPIKSLSATPLFLISEVETWMEKHGRGINRRPLPNPQTGNYKILAVCGRPRVGKSFTISMFSQDPYGYRTACSREGDDFTQCEVQNIIWENLDEGFAVFHSTDEIMDGIRSPLTPDRLSLFFDEVNDYIRECRQNGWDGEKDKGYHYIEIFTPPSDFARKIMRSNRLDYLIITDTPGVAENYGIVPIEKADLVLFILADSGKAEATKSFETLVEAMAPLVASSNACFLYRTNSSCDDEEEYEQMQSSAERAMKRFEDCFTSLKGSIIESSLDVLHPAASVLGIPIMKEKKNSPSEMMFQLRFEEKINQAFKSEALVDIEHNVIQKLKEYSIQYDVATKFLSDIFSDIQPKTSQSQNNYFYSFISNRHNRVKTVDNYRLLFESQSACRKQLQLLYNKFSQYKCSDFTETWQQSTIKYAYIALTSGIKSDIGIGHGGHPFEDRPPVTMLISESILADELISSLTQSGTSDSLSIYKRVFESNGVSSNSWNYVRVVASGDAFKKLELIKEVGLRHRTSDNLYDLVRNCYIGGLHKLAEYKVWLKILSSTEMSIQQAELKALDALKTTGY